MEFATYADVLIKIADRIARSSGESSEYRAVGVSSRPHKSSSYAVIGNDMNNIM